MKKYIALSTLLISTVLLVAQTKSALFIGNSYTASNNLPALIQNIALSFGDTLITDANTPGGYYFRAHKTNATTISKLQSQAWDVVVLQEQSQIPALPSSITGQDYCMPHSIGLDSMIKANYVCSETVFFMTWGRENGDASFCGQHPPVCTYNGMQQELRNMYMWMADTNQATVSPVGAAWKNVRDSFPSINLYSGDGSHPNLYGSYLAACVFYVTLYQKSCIGSTFIPVGIGTGDAVTLQTVATNTVLDSLSLWRIGANDAVADFSFSGEPNVSFSNTTTNGMTYYWSFGDGNNSTVTSPSHTYSGNGNYNVTLYAYSDDSCSVDSVTKVVQVLSAGIDGVEPSVGVRIYPNPTKDIITVNVNGLNLNELKLQLFDITGKELLFKKGNLTLDLTEYPKGVYHLKLSGPLNETYQIIKQ